jgi:flagellar motor switch protein FliM
VLRWRVGRTIHFSSPPPDIVIAKSGDQSLFSGAAGYKNGKIAIKVLDNLLLKEEFSMENNKESNEKMNVKLKEGEFA